MKRYLAALGGAVLASFVAAGIALAGEPDGHGVQGLMPVNEWHGCSSGASSGNAEGGDVKQDASQDNDTDQDADAKAKAIQLGGANLALNILSSGHTEQTNSNENSAKAENSNGTVQVIGQKQSATGGSASSGDAWDLSGHWNRCIRKADSQPKTGGYVKQSGGDGASSGNAEGGDVKQDASQDNDTDQDADAKAKAIQLGGANLALNILSSGDTEQTNSNENSAKAENSNGTVQVIGQDQDATGGDATSGDAAAVGTGGGSCTSKCEDGNPSSRWTGDYGKKSAGDGASSGDAEGGDVKQDADQDNDTDQDADATAKAIQVGGVNLGLNLLSDGGLDQSNSNENSAKAENSNATIQAIGQDQSATGGSATSGDDAALGNGWFGGSASSGDAEGGDVEQDADQDNDTDQDADATAKAIQFGGANLGLNVLGGRGGPTLCRCGDKGSDGLDQSNENENSAKAGNSNKTIQVIGQDQDATGGNATSGDAASLGNGWSRGGASSGDAEGGNVKQDADQDNDTDQDADATAKAIQVGGVNLGLNVLSSGDLEQSNSNENSAKAENSNATVQAIGQDQDATGGDATSGDALTAGLPAI